MWRLMQAVFDADRLGTAPTALAARAGKAVSGLIYGGLAVSVFGLLDAIEDLHEADDQAKTQAAVQNALAMPWGDILVMAVGAVILAAGAANVVRAFRDHFTDSLDCDHEIAGWTGGLARVGYAGRGLAMVPAGVVILSAGWHTRASEARSLGGALDHPVTAFQPRHQVASGKDHFSRGIGQTKQLIEQLMGLLALAKVVALGGFFQQHCRLLPMALVGVGAPGDRLMMFALLCHTA